MFSLRVEELEPRWLLNGSALVPDGPMHPPGGGAHPSFIGDGVRGPGPAFGGPPRFGGGDAHDFGPPPAPNFGDSSHGGAPQEEARRALDSDHAPPLGPAFDSTAPRSNLGPDAARTLNAGVAQPGALTASFAATAGRPDGAGPGRPLSSALEAHVFSIGQPALIATNPLRSDFTHFWSYSAHATQRSIRSLSPSMRASPTQPGIASIVNIPTSPGAADAASPTDLSALELGLHQFLNQLEQLDQTLAAFRQRTGVNPWLVAVAAVLTACEITRRQLKRSGKASPALAGGPDPRTDYSNEPSHE